MKNNHKIKLIAASLTLTTSFSALGGLGGLNVQSNLGEPFSGTVTVTGEEAKILLNGGSASLSDGNLRTSIRKSGNNAVINIRSNAPVNDPVLVFQVGVGAQSRQYTAIIDPADYPADNGAAAGSQTETRPAATAEGTADSQTEARQSAAAKAKLKAKKAQEQQARKEQQKAAEKTRETAAEHKPEHKKEPIGGSYRVRRGETLTSIASQVRPSGLSVYETIAAIMTANPEIFPTRNANQILAGRVLDIPSSEELKRLAKQKAPASETEQSPPPATQAQQPEQTEAVKPDTAATAATDTPASAPEAAASAPATEAASVPQTPAVPETAAEEGASKAEPAAPAAVPAAESDGSDGSGGSWRWLLFAGLAAIALWLLLKTATKKKAAVDEVSSEKTVIKDDTSALEDDAPHREDAETEIRTHKPVAYPSAEAKSSVPAAAAATAATAAAHSETQDSGLDVEDDFDDIFFSETEAQPVEKTEGNFNLDLNSIDREQGGIVSGALTNDEETQQREHADWDKIESTESVYEPETESEFRHVAVEFNAGEKAEESQEAGFSDSDAAFPQSDRGQADVSDAPLEFHTETPDDTVSEPALPAAEPDLVQIETADSGEEHVETVDIEALPFTGETATGTPSPAYAAPEAEPAVLGLAEVETEAETEAAGSFAAETAAETPQTAVEDYADGAYAAAQTTAAYPAGETAAWAESQQDGNFSFEDSEDFSGTVNLSADDTETIEWESIGVESEARDGDGFISESVGMTAPLEAKYELAQMYVEIGDPDAARETLQELLEESSGSILEKTKTMLAELDKA